MVTGASPLRAATAAAALAAPALAAACAACARDRSEWGPVLVGAMIAAPYLVAALVLRAIRAAGEGP